MMTITQCLEKAAVPRTERHALAAVLAKISEIFWFTVALLLFMVLGPFATPVVLMAIFGLAGSYRGEAEPESIS
ncbi:MAG: hypothetical protein ACK5PS_07110 [Desulfopila sp.]